MLTNQEKSVIAVERAIQELRSGRPIWLEGASAAPILFMAAEMSFSSVKAEAGKENFAMPAAAIQLLKLAQLLPYGKLAVSVDNESKEWLRVTELEIKIYQQALAETLTEIASASLPLKYAKEVQIKVFRPRFGMVEHLAVIFGAPETQAAPLIRIHSSCLTGDLLSSLRCDCGDQLHLALEAMAHAGHGVLCYLNQEGRGIGLGNKIRAYALQEEGKDTLEANELLGFAGDERQFAVAAAMLKKLGTTTIKLLTNNPKKVQELSEYGINIAQRVPLKSQPHEHNQRYIDTKAQKFGHFF